MTPFHQLPEPQRIAVLRQAIAYCRERYAGAKPIYVFAWMYGATMDRRFDRLASGYLFDFRRAA